MLIVDTDGLAEGNGVGVSVTASNCAFDVDMAKIKITIAIIGVMCVRAMFC